MSIFSEIFSWWGGNTWSNRIYTRLRGNHVGTDAMGNKYYEQSKGIGPVGVPRRWVIYKDLAEASFIPPGWHGWMHYTTDERPQPLSEDGKASGSTLAGENKRLAKDWEKPHQPNMTGTSEAYRPAGSILTSSSQPDTAGSYEAWRPE